MAYKPIEQYGLIGDMNSAALVGTDGSIDWCCFPRFDSPSVFAAILDDEEGGCFRIAPSSPDVTSRQAYIPSTNILETQFTTPTGELSLVDFMPVAAPDSDTTGPHEIHRIVRCTDGSVEVRCTFSPRFDYARATTDLRPLGEGVVARGGRQVLSLCTQVPLRIAADTASAQFSLSEGEEAFFVLAYGHARPQRLHTYRTRRKFERTKAYWELMASSLTYDRHWRDEVIRSFLVLHLMLYQPTGAIVAAPTCSLPEHMGGSRNWDYRYSWLRDSSFTMEALYRTGHTEDAKRYLAWLVRQCKVTNGRTRIVYGISPNSSLKETTLDHLEGHGGAGPVRIGNAAARHLQLDAFGEVILGIDALWRSGGAVSDDAWSLIERFAGVVVNNWHRKDRGVWEVRGRQQHFVYSKIMCWAALDRAAKLARVLGRNSEASGWSRTAAMIKEEVLRLGWSDRKRAFVQRYGGEALDASNLIIPFVGFLDSDDPRVSSNVDAITSELADGPFVRRYVPGETDDGLGGEEEGAFVFLSFWLVGNLIHTGQIDKAGEYFERILGCANHVGLFAEMIDPSTGRFMGNFPQAYSHIGLIHSARNLSRALNGKLKAPANGHAGSGAVV